MALYERDYANNHEAVLTQELSSIGFMKKTYQLLAASMVVAALGAYATMPYVETIAIPSVYYSIFGFELFMLFIGLRITRSKPGLNLVALFIFTFATGVTLVPLLSFFIASGSGAVIGNAFLATSVLFGSLSLFAINSKKDYSSWGKPLFITLIVIILASLINIFLLHSPMGHVIISAAVLLLFSLFTIYDTQNIANGAYSSPVEAAVSLYIDFLNMFSALLHLLGIFGDD
jgi:modulator of FtsH protease